MRLRAAYALAKASVGSSLMTAAALVALFSFTALQDLSGLLAGMHGDGQPSFGMQQLPHLLHPGPDSQHTEGVLDVWTGYENVRGTATPLTVTWWYIAVDTLFALAYSLWLFLWLRGSQTLFERWRSRWLERAERSAAVGGVRGPVDRLGSFFERLGLDLDQGLPPYSKAAERGRWLVAVVLLCEGLESLAQLRLVQLAEKKGPVSMGIWDEVLWGAAWGRWVSVGLLVGIALAVAWLRAVARFDDFRRALRTMLRVRVHVAILAVLAAILLVHEQLPDVIRRWTPIQVGWAVGFTLALALALWAVSRRLLLVTSTNTSLHALDWFGSVLVVVALVLVAGVLTVVDLSTGHNLGWGLALPAILAVLVLGLNGVFTRARPTSGLELPPLPATSVLPRLLASASLIVLSLAVLRASFGYAVYIDEWRSTWVVLLLAPAGAFVPRILAGRTRRLPREPLVWVLVGAIVAYGAIRAGDDGELHPTTLVASALLLGGVAWRLYPALRDADAKRGLSAVAALAGLPALGVWVFVIAEPLGTGDRLGGVGLLAAFLVVLCLVGGFLVWLSDTVEAPVPLRFFQLRRWPVLTLVALWFLSASLLDKGDFHDVRLSTSAAGASSGQVSAGSAMTLQAAFDCWLAKNGLPGGNCARLRHPTTGSRPATPLFLVAASGGGIRAAYWTALTLDCAFELVPGEGPRACPPRRRTPTWWRSNTLLAGSGISGGSLGLASYAAYLATKSDARSANDWVQRRLDQDSLSASIGWWLFVEGPRSLLRFDGGTDRAEILERGWERPWGGDDGALAEGLFQFASANPQAPLLLLNGTSVEDGCRFNASVLDANVEGADGEQRYDCRASDPFDDGVVSPNSVLGATRDLADFLCRRAAEAPVSHDDIPLSTAALLSGRFPFVSPSGRLERRCTRDDETPVTYIVDGGYLEPSGSGTILDVAEALEPIIGRHNADHPDRCVVPFLIQIDNGATAAAENASQRPRELLVPLATLFATRGARGADARADTGLQFSSPASDPEQAAAGTDRYIHFQNKAHPGPQAPLGWTLSGHSMQDLEAQLELNSDEFLTVRRVLAASRSGQLRCA